MSPVSDGMISTASPAQYCCTCTSSGCKHSITNAHYDARSTSAYMECFQHPRTHRAAPRCGVLSCDVNSYSRMYRFCIYTFSCTMMPVHMKTPVLRCDSSINKWYEYILLFMIEPVCPQHQGHVLRCTAVTCTSFPSLPLFGGFFHFLFPTDVSVCVHYCLFPRFGIE